MNKLRILVSIMYATKEIGITPKTLKIFHFIAKEDFYIIPHGTFYSVLLRIAWGLMFELAWMI